MQQNQKQLPKKRKRSCQSPNDSSPQSLPLSKGAKIVQDMSSHDQVATCIWLGWLLTSRW